MTIDELCTAIETGGMGVLMESGTEELQHHSVRVYGYLSQMNPADVIIILAVALAMEHADVEGKAVELEKESGELIGEEKRMQLFLTMYRTAFKDAYQFRMEQEAKQAKETGRYHAH